MFPSRFNLVVIAFVFAACMSQARAGTEHVVELQDALTQLTQHFDGRVGICVQDSSESVAEINGDESFPLQSVMKLVVCLATLDKIDNDGWRLGGEVVVKPEDLSLAVQPIAKLVTPAGYHTDIASLIRGAIIDSDSAASDFLVARLGGPKAVQAYLNREKMTGVRIDRDERHLQTEITGLTWRAEFVDHDVLNRAIDAVPMDERDAAYRRYQTDARDTATPMGMARLLSVLVQGKLLSAKSTSFCLEVMHETKTFPDRLKAGVPEGWRLAHKTGTSSSWKGVTAATNDVGVLTAPSGDRLSVVVFIADSAAPDKVRAKLMANIAKAVVEHYEP